MSTSQNQQPDPKNAHANTAVAWLSSVRYTRPLSATDAKKWQLLRERLGVPIYVLAMSSSLRPRRFDEHARFYLLPLLPLALLRYAMVLAAAVLWAWWVMARHGVRVFIAQSPYEGASGAFALAVARRLGVRGALIVEAHNDFENNLFTLRRVTFTALYRALMEKAARYAVRRAAALRAVSRSTEAQLRALAPDTPLVRFMTWTDMGAFAKVARHVSLTKAHTLVYVGVLTQLKGVHVLLEAFARLPERFELVLIGAEEQPAYAAQLRDRCDALGIAKRVQWRGKLAQAELAQEVADARALVLPSLSEGLPRVIIEGMTCGTPVVATAVGGIPEVLQDGVNGWLVAPDDVDALARVLHAATHADADTLARLTAAARATAQATFSTEAYLQGYQTLVAYGRAACAPPAAPLRLLLFNLATDADHQVLSFTSAWINALASHCAYVDVLTMQAGRLTVAPNVRVYSVGKERGWSEPRRALNFYGHLLRLLTTRRYDVCFAHMMPLFALMGAPLLALWRVPLVLWYTHRQKTRILAGATWWARRVVTAAPSSFPIATPKLRPLGHGIDTTFYQPSAAPSTEQAVVYVARLTPIKRQVELLCATATLDADVWLIGDKNAPEDAAYKAELEALACDPQRVRPARLLGKLPPEAVRAYVQQAAIAVNLSPVGSFDKAALEAMACGVPTLVRSPDFAPLLGDHAPYLLLDDPSDTPRLRALLAHWLDIPPAERARVGAELRAAVQTQHSLPRLMARLVSVLRMGEVDDA